VPTIGDSIRMTSSRGSTGAGSSSAPARRGRPFVAPPNGDPGLALLDCHLADARLLHDPDDLPDAIGFSPVDTCTGERLRLCAATSDRPQERLGLLAEERQQEKLLLARGNAVRFLAQLVDLLRGFLGSNGAVSDELHRSAHDGIHLARRRAVAALDQVAQLVDDDVPALGGEHMEERLRPENLPDRRCKRRPAGFGPDLVELVENVIEPIRNATRPQLVVQLGDEARRQAMLGSSHGDPRRKRRNGLVSQRFVHELRAAPERRHVHARVETQPGERLGESLG
jgi:hypothetical protein